MKTTVTETQFKDAFKNYGREDNFSYDGLTALFEWFEEYEESTGVEVEFDCIAICCDFSEHESAIECISDNGYAVDYTGCNEEEEQEAALEYLNNDNTCVIEFEGGIIIQAF